MSEYHRMVVLEITRCGCPGEHAQREDTQEPYQTHIQGLGERRTVYTRPTQEGGVCGGWENARSLLKAHVLEKLRPQCHGNFKSGLSERDLWLNG